MLTEDEARKRWCPFVRRAVPAYNRLHIDSNDLDVDHGCACIASACMAWRWAKDQAVPMSQIEFVKTRRDETGCTLSEAVEFSKEHPELWGGKPTRGYCGLAGSAQP